MVQRRMTMKKILLVLLFLSVSAFADLYVDSVYTGPKHTSAIGEESAAPKEESACVSGEKDDRGSPVRFFGEIGLLDLGVGLRFYIGETWHQYMQVSLQFDWNIIRIPAVWHLGGENFHVILGYSANVAAAAYSLFSTAFIFGLNYDINRHVGFNAEVLLSAPTSILLDVQLAF